MHAQTRAQLLTRELELERKLHLLKARRALMPFITYVKSDYRCSWHHRAISMLVQMLNAGATTRDFLAWCGWTGKRLDAALKSPHEVTKLYAGMTRPEMIDEPLRNVQIWVSPRAGKSEIVSRQAPAWWLGLDPDARILGTSFGAKFAEQISKDVQRIIDTTSYHEVFPNTRIVGRGTTAIADGNYQRNNEIFEIINARGYYKSAGIGGGGLMGRGGDLALVDDFYKSRKQADSAVERLNTWEWYNSTLYSRLEKGAKRLVICTRWRADDLSQQINDQAAADISAEQYFCLVFPAILDCEPGPGDPRKQGEALWPEKYDLKKLEQIRSTMGTYEFEALHQQRPSPKGGGIVKEEWWRFYDQLPEGLTDHTISVDLSFKERGDYSAFQVWAAKGANRFLLDQYLARLTFTQQLRALILLCKKWPMATVKLIEDAANGAALVDTLRNEVQGLVPVRASVSKALRVDAISPQIEAGNVYLPSRRLAPWVDGFIGEFNFFPNGAQDDQIDAASQALFYMKQQEIKFDFTVSGITKTSQWL